MLHRSPHQAALVVRYRLHDRASAILTALETHHPVDELLLRHVERLYLGVRTATKVLPTCLQDPVWGLLPAEGFMTEDASREFLIGEMEHIKRGLEREIGDLLPAGLAASPLGRMIARAAAQ
ncbi:hypothetical protein HK105_201571 [Polyrhizophydium stewartii]|uniref:Uncharacterized protein n=1 Tax=Polyrhizophydium stewartii TaxID=2732419 RepID=A0ABR4NGT8_9FUNG|nr:hypothetical protein HK105_002980 [Polyrhizophydium stewartii]